MLFMEVECRRCNGDGKTHSGVTCSECKGAGIVEENIDQSDDDDDA